MYIQAEAESCDYLASRWGRGNIINVNKHLRVGTTEDRASVFSVQ